MRSNGRSDSRCGSFKSAESRHRRRASMSSIGPGIYELKEADERAWYRAIYLSKVGNTIYVLHCFEKESRKTDRRDIEVATQRLKLARQRLQEQRAHEKRSEK
ncbi:MAG: type II toxin-antitoxin system RelE/ParE family toxin [Terracidiphilus sp.]